MCFKAHYIMCQYMIKCKCKITIYNLNSRDFWDLEQIEKFPQHEEVNVGISFEVCVNIFSILIWQTSNIITFGWENLWENIELRITIIFYRRKLSIILMSSVILMSHQSRIYFKIHKSQI
jgi:hypothetical protein